MKKCTVLLMAALLVLCSLTSALASDTDKIELTVWHGFTSDATKSTIEGLLDEFNTVQDEIVIRYESFSSSDLLQAYTLGVVSGELPDIGFNDNPGWASLCELGVFSSIQNWFDTWSDKNVWRSNILASGYYEDELYGIPCGPNCLALWCNTEMLKKAGYDTAPTTWEEFAEVAKATTDPGNGVYGFAMGGSKGEAGTYQNMPWVLSAGGSIFDLKNEGTMAALNMINELFQNGYCSAESLNWTQSDALNQFLAGNCAMYLSGSWNVATQRKKNPDIQYTCTAIPAYNGSSVSCLGGELIGITSACQQREAAQSFLEWFLSKEVQLKFCKGCTRFSARSDVAADELFPDDATMAVYAELLETAGVRGPSPAWVSVSGVFQNVYQMVYTSAKTVEQAVTDAQLEVDAIMAEYE